MRKGMTRNLLPMALLLMVMLLTACGRDSKERGLASDFMEQSLGVKEYDVVKWSAVDSTFFVSDSMLQVMRAQAASKIRGEVHYVAPTPKLLYLNLRYAVGKDTLARTFYFDDRASGIVGFKDN